ncbi:MAG: ATP-binding protein, partial [Acidimicrobiales bacterium]
VAGTGIGLAVTAALVAAHHGTVEVTSPTGGGTRAIVRLPKAPR